MVETNQKHFKPKAHILRLLGEELIKNPVMAIYELIKNSYDADARGVEVRFENVDDIRNTRICSSIKILDLGSIVGTPIRIAPCIIIKLINI